MHDCFFDHKMDLYIDREYICKITVIESMSTIQPLVEKMEKSVLYIEMTGIDIFVTTSEGDQTRCNSNIKGI